MRIAGKLLWREIEAALASELKAGVFAPGSRLPPADLLAARFGVNRHTLRRALAALAEQGAIRIEHGRGMFVAAPPIDYPIARRTRFSEIITRGNRTPAGRLLRAWETPAEGRLAEDLELPEGTPCLVVEALREANGRPLSITAHHFDLDRFRGLDRLFAETGSISRALAAYGVGDYARRRTRVHAREATLEEASLLQVARAAPVLVIESVNTDADGLPVEFGSSRSAGGMFQAVFES